MKMNKDELISFIKELAEVDASEIKLENGGLKISIKHGSEIVYTSNTTQESIQESTPVVSSPVLEDSEETKVDEVKPGIAITAPIDGTYYSSSGPDAPPYVKVGDTLKKGDPICILEAMKMMNTVDMPESGTIIAVEANNEDIVAAGQVLVRYER